MSAPTDIMSRKRSAARPANMVAVWFKIVSTKLYVALDKTQRKRAAEIIQRYAHLIPEENSGEQKKAFLSRESDYESRQFWPVTAWNRERRGSKT
jgi:archaellum biogenesis protein FlaJ (TadC family)